MKIAIIGGGASGMVTAYLLGKNGHHVTVFEKQPILGGHIRTLNKNVKPNHSDCDRLLENGVLEFPVKFHNFVNLMKELEVELEPVNIGSSLFFKDGRHFLSRLAIQKNFTGIQRFIEYLKLDTLYVSSAGLWVKMRSAQMQDFYNQPMSQYFKCQRIRNYWIKLLAMYSYSMPFEMIDNFPAELAIPALRDYVFTNWVRIKGGVYSYIEKILERFQGEILLNVEVAKISRQMDAVKIWLSDGVMQTFDKVVFATPPDQVMKLLSDPTNEEIKRFSAWKENYATTVLHQDNSMYGRYGIKQLSEFDFFQTNNGWGYNAYLNQLCGISSSLQYSLAFNLDELIAEDKILHVQEHHTPLYTVESFRYRDEVVSTNGENNTYHAGAYLGDGLHEGAIASAIRVAQLIG
ncbi:MAG: FAD-dependent oxidoreductase [Heteroscytonema crispum UTEX LB 1556]